MSTEMERRPGGQTGAAGNQAAIASVPDNVVPLSSRRSLAGRNAPSPAGPPCEEAGREMEAFLNAHGFRFRFVPVDGGDAS